MTSISASSVLAQGMCFTDAGAVAGGDLPVSVTCADLNGDGRADIASVDGSTVGRAWVALSLGGGSFAPSTSYVVGVNPVAAVAADFDGDGIVDLAVANALPASVSILRGQGNGTFVVQPELLVGTQLQHLVALDVDGNGSPDLVVADYEGGRVIVLHNAGNGTFPTRDVYPVGYRPFWIATGDLDGDGNVDLAVAVGQAARVALLFNQGNGMFGTQFLPTPNSTTDGTAGPDSVACADMNGDGALDFVVGIYPSTLAIYFNQGSGTFGVPVTYPTVFSVHAVHCADFNGDGWPDVVDASYGHTAVARLNQGGGVLGPQQQFDAGGPSFSLDVADLDDDGALDVAITDFQHDRTRVLRNCGNAISVICTGDGSGTACPCGNNSPGGSQAGCRNSFGTAGRLVASGIPSLSFDTLVLSATGMGRTTSFYLQGTLAAAGGAGVNFGDGNLCLAGALTRIGRKPNFAGASSYPGAGDPTIGSIGHANAGSTFLYQVVYGRDDSFCTARGVNTTNACAVQWSL